MGNLVGASVGVPVGVAVGEVVGTAVGAWVQSTVVPTDAGSKPIDCANPFANTDCITALRASAQDNGDRIDSCTAFTVTSVSTA